MEFIESIFKSLARIGFNLYIPFRLRNYPETHSDVFHLEINHAQVFSILNNFHIEHSVMVFVFKLVMSHILHLLLKITDRCICMRGAVKMIIYSSI